MIKSISSTLLESKSIYCPVSDLMNQFSGFSTLIALLIATPRLKAQKAVARLSVSAMAFCVMRNGWLSFTHTIHAISSCTPNAWFALTAYQSNSKHEPPLSSHGISLPEDATAFALFTMRTGSMILRTWKNSGLCRPNCL